LRNPALQKAMANKIDDVLKSLPLPRRAEITAQAAELAASMDLRMVEGAAESPAPQPQKARYDLAHLAGRLQWQGDAVAA
jgi:hypothetical protein